MSKDEETGMKWLSAWGLSAASWKGGRGEYWVLLQGVFLIGYAFIPVYHPEVLLIQPPSLYVIWAIATLIGLMALVLLVRGLLDLGANLTPLPFPRDEGQLVQSGIYGLVRHPLYGGLILATFAWAVFQISLSHLIGAIALFLFLNAKANREEIWLRQKYPDYDDYQHRVKKLLPWLF